MAEVLVRIHMLEWVVSSIFLEQISFRSYSEWSRYVLNVVEEGVGPKCSPRHQKRNKQGLYHNRIRKKNQWNWKRTYINITTKKKRKEKPVATTTRKNYSKNASIAKIKKYWRSILKGQDIIISIRTLPSK